MEHAVRKQSGSQNTQSTTRPTSLFLSSIFSPIPYSYQAFLANEILLEKILPLKKMFEPLFKLQRCPCGGAFREKAMTLKLQVQQEGRWQRPKTSDTAKVN